MNVPAQYLLAIGGSGGTPAVKHTLSVTVTNGDNIVTSVKEGAKKTVTIVPNLNYLPPKVVDSGGRTIEYDKYTGTLSTVMGTTDISMSATCVAMPKTFDTMKTFPMTYDELKAYKLTYDKLKG